MPMNGNTVSRRFDHYTVISGIYFTSFIYLICYSKLLLPFLSEYGESGHVNPELDGINNIQGEKSNWAMAMGHRFG